MTDDMLWTHRPAPPRQPTPGEPLWAFVRERDRVPFACELRFHGDSYGWEAQILRHGELFSAHGAFPTRGLAIVWAEQARRELERGGTT